MPLMMEDEMDMDDLFGEGGGLALPSPSITKEVYQRLDESRGASITRDGKNLELRNLRCHPDSGNWALSHPTVTSKLLFGGIDCVPLKHLSWSPTGSDLAVIDTLGRIIILAVFSSLNKPTLSRLFESDQADDLHAVVGCYWLNLAPPPLQKQSRESRGAILHGPGVKEGSTYRYEVSSNPILGPYHPHPSRSALVYLTSNGLLRMLWQQNTSKWTESHTELESTVSSDDLITHGAICPDKNGTLLVAFATTTKQLRTVRALIEWNQPKADKVHVSQLPLNPIIKTKHLAVTSWSDDITNDSTNSIPFNSMVQLSHLEFLAPCEDANKKPIPATIMVIRSHLPSSTSQFNQDIFTTTDRWEVREKSQSVHPAFEQLSSRRSSVSSQPASVFYLKRLEKFTVTKIAIKTEIMNFGRVVFFAYSDGSIEYRDRATMSETFNDGDLDRVWHLSQVGYTYPDDEPCLEVALSPTFSSVIQIGNDYTVRWRQLEHPLGDIGSGRGDAQYAATITALTMACATAIMRGANPDDLLAIAYKHATAQFAFDWLTELSVILKVNTDYSEDATGHHDTLVRNPTLLPCLGIQNALGFRGEFNPRTFSGKFAWLALQLRNIVVLVSMAAISIGPNSAEKTSPLEDPEIINSLVGSVRWILDFVAWLIDTLLTLPSTIPSTIDLTDGSTLSLPDLLAHLHSSNNICLHILLASSTRGFLSAMWRRLQHLDFIARKALTAPQTAAISNNQSPNNISPALRQAYEQIASLTQRSVISITAFQIFLSSLSQAIKTSYQSVSPPLAESSGADRERGFLETKMLFGGSFPPSFRAVIVDLFRKNGGMLEILQQQLDPTRLFFMDFTSLEVDEDAISVRKRKKMACTMDSFRKIWLRNPSGKRTGQESTSRETQGRAWKRCSRCAAVMEDIPMQRQQMQWLVMHQRRCFCGGFWNILPDGDVVA